LQPAASGNIICERALILLCRFQGDKSWITHTHYSAELAFQNVCYLWVMWTFHSPTLSDHFQSTPDGQKAEACTHVFHASLVKETLWRLCFTTMFSLIVECPRRKNNWIADTLCRWYFVRVARVEITSSETDDSRARSWLSMKLDAICVPQKLLPNSVVVHCHNYFVLLLIVKFTLTRWICGWCNIMSQPDIFLMRIFHHSIQKIKKMNASIVIFRLISRAYFWSNNF